MVGAEELYRQHEHHREYIAEYNEGNGVFEKPEASLEANLVLDASREYTALLAEIRSVDANISPPV